MTKSLKLFGSKRTITARNRERRGSRHERGYDATWTRRADAYRSRNPLCVECENEGRVVPADLVDHKIPVRDRPDLRLDESNWWSMCKTCHNTIKVRMEAYARKMGKIDILMMWCDEPLTRPKGLRETRPGRDSKRPDMQV